MAFIGIPNRTVMKVARENAGGYPELRDIYLDMIGLPVTGLPMAMRKPTATLVNQLARTQRGAPEKAMLKVQRVHGGGVLNPVVENVGDLIHRMSQRPEFFGGYYEGVAEKLRKIGRYLFSDFGFEKEHVQNVLANARVRGITVEEHNKRLSAVLRQFAEEHAKLPVYNEAQRTAKDAAVSLGLGDFEGTRRAITKLKEMTAGGEAAWKTKAMENIRLSR